MNKDINYTLMALVPIFNANKEKIVRIEAVRNWYKYKGSEYMKEVAEITYENGYRKYADIDGDRNLTAVYDVIAVIQDIKPQSEAIEHIERGVYEMPVLEWTNFCNGKPCPYTNECNESGMILFCRESKRKRERYYIRGRKPETDFYSFKYVCRRDDIPVGGYTKEYLEKLYESSKYAFPDMVPPSIDVWIDELKEMGMYKEDVKE